MAGPAATTAIVTWRELVGLVRDRTALFFVVVLPVVVIVIIGSTFGVGPSVVDLGVVDRDGSALSGELVEALDASGALVVEDYDDPAQLRRDVRTGAVAAGVVVPEGFAARVRGGGTAEVALVEDPAAAATSAVRSTVVAAAAELSARLAAAQVAAEVTGVDRAAGLALAEEVAGGLERAEVAVTTVGEVSPGEEGRYSYTAPSNLVLFTFIISVTASGVVVEARRLGVVRRMLATPTAAWSVVAGFGAARLVLALVQSVLILGIGSLLFAVDWGDPSAALVLVLAFAVVASGAGMLIGAVADDPNQVQAVGPPVAIVLGMLGGCMWPLGVVGDTMRTVGHLTPHAWAMDGWIEVIFEGGGLADIADELAVLAAFAVALGGLATWRLHRAVTGA